MLFAFAEAFVLTLPAAEPLAVPADPPVVGGVNAASLSMLVLNADPAAAVTVLSAPIPLTVTSLLLLSAWLLFSKEPEIVPLSDSEELMFSYALLYAES